MEAIVYGVPSDGDLGELEKKCLNRSDVFIIGPGLSRSPGMQEFGKKVFKWAQSHEKIIVLDGVTHLRNTITFLNYLGWDLYGVQ